MHVIVVSERQVQLDKVIMVVDDGQKLELELRRDFVLCLIGYLRKVRSNLSNAE